MCIKVAGRVVKHAPLCRNGKMKFMGQRIGCCGAYSAKLNSERKKGAFCNAPSIYSFYACWAMYSTMLCAATLPSPTAFAS